MALSKLRDYLKLTKPSIGLLVVITGATALVMEGTLVSRPWDFVLMLLGLFLTSGCASALNQYLERDIDAQMKRTAKKRPIANGSISPRDGLIFAIAIGVIGCAILWLRFNPLSSLLAFATIIFYAFFYTLWLKPRTHLNIVIGGAAGAMGPLIAWAAATNGLALTPWVLFLIIFFWTPPHFWALAYCLKEDYKTVKYPMLPIVRSDTETLRQIMIYTIITVLLTLALSFFGVGVLYLTIAILLGAGFLWQVMKVSRTHENRAAMKLFLFSIAYLLILFVGLMIDAALPIQPWKG